MTSEEIRLAGQRAGQALAQHHTPDIYQRQQAGQQSVLQGAADDDIDIEQPVAQDGDTQAQAHKGKTKPGR